MRDQPIAVLPGQMMAPVLALFVCGGACTNSSAEARPSATVEMTAELRFVPAQLEIEVGEQVLWKNVSELVHTVTADASKAIQPEHVLLPQGAEPFDSGPVEPDGTYTRTFSVAGRYRYFCLPHELSGMVAELLVKP